MKITECGFVYMITSPKGRLYVGSCNNIERRWNQYRTLNCKPQRLLYNSFKKYGVKNHKFEIVWAGLLSEMYKYETLIGWGFNTLVEYGGLNLRLPKLGDIYSCMSDETKNKISTSKKGKKEDLIVKKQKLI